MSRRRIRRGIVGVAATLTLLGAPLTQSEPQNVQGFEVSHCVSRARSGPSAEHLEASTAAAEAIFAAQRTATADRALLDLRESLAEVRTTAKRVAIQRRSPLLELQAPGAHPRTVVALRGRDPAIASASEAELRGALARLELSIQKAEARGGHATLSADVLRQASQKARELNAHAIESIDAPNDTRGFKIRNVAATLVPRKRDGRAAAQPATDENPSVMARHPADRRAPMLGTITRHRKLP
jgi:hypothetical protein